MHRLGSEVRPFVLVLVIALLAALPARATLIVIDNGGAPPDPANVIDDVIADAFYEVRDSAEGDPTAVLFVAPATFLSLQVFGGSSAVLEKGTGGDTGELRVQDRGSLVIRGGNANIITARGHASLVLESGGHTPGPDSVLEVSGDATATILGGLVADSGLQVHERGEVTIRGGQFVDLFGMTPGIWGLGDEATVTVHGANFAIDGAAVPFGEVAIGGRLTGTLESGEPLDVDVSRHGTARLLLVPEPSFPLLLGMGLAVLGALTRSAGRKSSA